MFFNSRTHVAIGAGVLLLAGVGAAAWIHSAENSLRRHPLRRRLPHLHLHWLRHLQWLRRFTATTNPRK